MIENENQLKVTKRWLEEFKWHLHFLNKALVGDELLHNLEVNAVKMQIADLETQIAEYRRVHRFTFMRIPYDKWIGMYYNESERTRYLCFYTLVLRVFDKDYT